MKSPELQNGFAWGPLFLVVLLTVSCSPEGNKSTSSMFTGSGGISVGEDSVSGNGGSDLVEPQAGTDGWYDIREVDGALGSARTMDVDGGACKGVTAVGENVEVDVPVEVVVPSPIALYIMLDASLSMSYDPPRWQPAVDALNEFINDPDSEGIDVAFETFPLPATDPQVVNAALDCTGVGYNEPAIPMGPLPDNATAIVNYLPAVGPVGIGTPMEAALNGATQYCAAFKEDTNANPDGEDCVVILITDGTPEIVCNLDPVLVSDIAGQAQTDNGIRTFPIGMAGADFTFLNMVGQKGNGDCTLDDGDATWACDVSQTGGAGLLEALNAIRDFVTEMQIQTEIQTKIVDCEWTLPEPPIGQVLEYDKVNFQFTTGGDDPVQRIVPQVDSVKACKDVEEAWYYDNMDEPTKILVCPDTCETVRAEEQARIDILLGCDTIEIE